MEQLDPRDFKAAGWIMGALGGALSVTAGRQALQRHFALAATVLAACVIAVTVAMCCGALATLIRQAQADRPRTHR